MSEPVIRVRMLRRRTWQNAGRAEVLELDREYALPVVVARSLIATGTAVRVEEP